MHPHQFLFIKYHRSVLPDLERDGFGPNPLFQCHLAEVPVENKSEEGKHQSTTLHLSVMAFSQGSLMNTI